MRKTALCGIIVGALVAGAFALYAGGDIKECFGKSLHATGEGMRYWYEEAGGMMKLTGIPYKDLDCSNCHIKSCDKCHDQAEPKKGDDMSKANNSDTCLVCHGREKLTYKMCAAKDKLDVHKVAGKSCSECHGLEDVHGDCEPKNSMRDKGAVKAKCANCHEDLAGRPHTVHKGKLDCAACHVENTIACMNCHMDTFLETGSRKGNFVPMHDWLLLMNYEGKVTSATAMTLVHKDKKFICYAPYFTHAIQPKGKTCTDCHANEAMKLIKAGKPVPMMKFVDGKVVNWQGVVPMVEGQLEWVYLNKTKDGGWTPITEGEETVQYVGYGTPLTEKQIKKMKMPFKK